MKLNAFLVSMALMAGILGAPKTPAGEEQIASCVLGLGYLLAVLVLGLFFSGHRNRLQHA